MTAGTGARENRSGSTATVALPKSWPSGEMPSSAADDDVPISSAIAPSFSGDELPAVTVPPVLKADGSAASRWAVVSGRTDSSRATPSTVVT